MIILNDGTYYQPDDAQIIKWQRAYQNIDVHNELEAIANWAEANPARRKKSGPRFVVNWLKRANDSGGSPFAKQQKVKGDKIERTRDMSWDDELTHDFTGKHQAHFLEKFGRCFTNKGEVILRERTMDRKQQVSS